MITRNRQSDLETDFVRLARNAAQISAANELLNGTSASITIVSATNPEIPIGNVYGRASLSFVSAELHEPNSVIAIKTVYAFEVAFRSGEAIVSGLIVYDRELNRLLFRKTMIPIEPPSHPDGSPISSGEKYMFTVAVDKTISP